MNELTHKKRLITLAYIAAGAVGAWLCIRYLISWIAPFLMAGATAALIKKPIDSAVERLHFKRSAAAAVFTLFVTAAVLSLGALIALEIYRRLSDLAGQLPELLELAGAFVQRQYAKLDNIISRTPPQTARLLESTINSVLDNASQIPATLSGRLLDGAASIASAVPKLILFIAAYVIGTYFISASYGDISAFLVRQLPETKRGALPKIKKSVASAVGKWLRSELTLMAVTFTQLGISFFLLRVDGALGAAVLVSIVDALPILGVGTVLIPWAMSELLRGSVLRAVALALTYGICTVVRSFLEPKLIGTHGGLHPVAALAAVYVGFSCAGLAGMLLFPVALMILVQLHENGILTVWK